MNQPNKPPETVPHPSTPAEIDQPIDDVALFKRKRVLVPLFLMMVIVLIGAGVWYGKRFSTIATDDAFIDADRLTVSAKILGRITMLGADEGDTVRRGDTIVRLDDADIRAQLEKAQAAVRLLTRSSEIATVNLEKARDDFKRSEKQFQGQIVTQEQFTHAQNALKLAEAQGDMALAQIATARADLEIVKIQLGHTAILAPFSGLIAKRWVLRGDVVQPGQAIFSLYDARHPWVTANYEETKLHGIRIGMRAAIALDAFPGLVVNGAVQRIGSTTASQFSLIPPGNASGNFTKVTQRVPVRIALDTQAIGIALLPGLSATVHIMAQ